MQVSHVWLLAGASDPTPPLLYHQEQGREGGGGEEDDERIAPFSFLSYVMMVDGLECLTSETLQPGLLSWPSLHQREEDMSVFLFLSRTPSAALLAS